MDAKRRTVVTQPYKLKELALLYRVSCYLMRKMLAKNKKAIGKREGYFYNTEQVEKIFGLYKLPSDIDLV